MITYLMTTGEVSFNLARAGGIIRDARESIGWSLVELARRAGVSPSQVLRVECAEHEYTVNTLVRICAPLGLRYGLLLERCTEPDTKLYREAMQKEEDIGQLGAYRDSEDKSTALAFQILVVNCCVCLAVMVRCADPRPVVEDAPLLVDELKEAFRTYAQRLQQRGDFLPIDRARILMELKKSPAAALVRYGLLNEQFVQKFLAIPEKIRMRGGRPLEPARHLIEQAYLKRL